MRSGTHRRGRSKWKSAMTNSSFGLRVRDDGKGIDPKVLDGDGRDGHYRLAWHARTRQTRGRQADGLERASILVRRLN